MTSASSSDITLWNGWRLAIHASLPSTSDHLVALAGRGEPEGLAVLARQQTKGRGSRGRDWASPVGNLCLSVLLRPGGEAAESGRWALLAGLALHDALAAFLPEPAALQLKWPNDVLLHGRKLAGILIDSASDRRERLAWLVIGFGANLAARPDLVDRPTGCLAEETTPPPPEQVARLLLNRLAVWRQARALSGFAAIRDAWLARAHPIGVRLAVRFEGSAAEGGFAGLDEDGSLLLLTADGVRKVRTGEVLLAKEG